MTVSLNNIIQWFRDREGQITYSMYGSRNGDDGTADCSGSMTQALYESGASKPAYLYSTETIHSYLIANGFQLIVENDQNGWDAQAGDIVIWGQQGSSSGAGGHIMIMTSGDPDNYCISTCYYTGGEEGTAIQELKYNDFVAMDNYPYYYVYRLSTTATPVARWKTGSKGIWYDLTNGKFAKGWTELDGTWYLFDNEGWLQSGWREIDGNWFLLNDQHDGTFGALLTGWQTRNGHWYYLSLKNGTLQTGWREINGKWYYLSPANGIMQQGWLQLDNQWYWFNEDGSMSTGWVSRPQAPVWYHMDDKGVMQTGTHTIDDKQYTFDENGKMK